jgi:hypothetical protein
MYMTAVLTKAAELQIQLTDQRFDEWLLEDVFHIRWWALPLLFIIDICVWWKVIDKSRLNEIILFAAITSIMILALDELGEELTLWDYPTDVFPLFPPVAAINLSCLPSFYAILYQFFSKWKGYVIASVLMAAFSCFVFEPIFIGLGMYQLLTWKPYYGFPLYFAIGIITKALLGMIKAINKKNSSPACT